MNSVNFETYKFGDFELTPAKRLLERAGVSIHLTARLMDALVLLVENHGKVVTREEFFKRLWPDSFVEENNLNQAISALRKALGVQATGSEFIETVPKVGYRFIAPVEKADGSHSKPVVPAVAPKPVKKPPIKKPLILAVALLVVVSVGGAAFVYRLKRTVSASPRRQDKNAMFRLTNFDGEERAAEFTRDGRIRFVRFIDKVAYSFQMNSDGSNTARDTSIPGLQTGRWSPDGSKVFFHSEGGGADKPLYLVNADGGNVQQMPFQMGNAMWSPDSRKLLFQSSTLSKDKNNSDIYLYDLDSTKITPVVESPAFDGDPSFAPDGAHILFVSDRDGNIEIYSKDLTSGALVRLTNNPGHDAFPTFSPDGTQIVFTSNREKENYDVYLMNADGSDPRKLTDFPGHEAVLTNCWSQDGTRILITSDKGGSVNNTYVMNVETSNPKLLISEEDTDIFSPSYSPDGSQLLVETKNPDAKASIGIYRLQGGIFEAVAETMETGSQPAFSPDGKRIAFKDKVDGNSEVFVMNSDGSGRTNLSQNPAADSCPSWSPDGSKIVFVSNREGDLVNFGLMTMNADGSGQRLVYYADSFAAYPRFTPDGRSLIFQDDKIDGRTGNFELLMVNAESGRDERRLTFRRKYDVQPVVSPDGKWIAFASNADGNSEIYVMRLDRSGLLRITRDLADDHSPAWSPDSRRIVFSSNRGGKMAIYEVTL
jgi:TolB protein